MGDGALTKADMAERLFEELGLNKREAKEIVEQFFEEIRLSLEQNEQVKLSGYGNFDLRDKKQRPGRNPKTGEEIPITKNKLDFKEENNNDKREKLLDLLTDAFEENINIDKLI